MQKTNPLETHTEWFFLCNNDFMLSIILGVGTRIVSNSFLNTFQKMLTTKGNNPSVINFYTYIGLTLVGLCLLPLININLNSVLLINTFIMGLLGALGNYYIIKALSVGELSALAPINSYKPIIALIIGFLCLHEIPSIFSIVGIIFIIVGTYHICGSRNIVNKTAIMYRVLALIFSGTEAVFIKKIINMTDVVSTLFLWAASGALFSLLFTVKKRNLKITSLKNQLFLILSVALMQYSTNFVFSKMNVAYALALFQLSTILSVFLGVNIFNEKELKRKLTASVIMIIGAVIIILA